MNKEIYKEILRASLPEEVLNIDISKYKSYRMQDDILKSNLFIGNYVEDEKRAFIKMHMIRVIIKNSPSSFMYLSSKDMFDIFMSDDNELQSRVVKTPYLYLKIGNDTTNSYLKELFPSILNDRLSSNLYTILIWNNKMIRSSSDKVAEIKKKYGDESYKIITSEYLVYDKHISLSGGEFKIVGRN